MDQIRWNRMSNMDNKATIRKYGQLIAALLFSLASTHVGAAMCGLVDSAAGPFAPPPPPGDANPPSEGNTDLPALIGPMAIRSALNGVAGSSVTVVLPDVCEYAVDPDDDDIVWRLAGESGSSASSNGVMFNLVNTADGQSLTVSVDAPVESAERTIDLVVAESAEPNRQSSVVSFAIQIDADGASKAADIDTDSMDADAAGGLETDMETGGGDAVIKAGLPGTPVNVVAERLASGQIQVSWQPASDGQGVKGFNVFRDGNYLASVFAPSFIDTDDSGESSVSYRIGAFSDDDKFSDFSEVVTVDSVIEGNSGSDSSGEDGVSTAAAAATDADSDEADGSDVANGGGGTNGDDIPAMMTDAVADASSKATVPVELVASSNAAGTIMIHWVSGDENTRGFNVYRNGLYLETVFETQFLDEGVVDGVLYQYAVAAFDFENLSSALSLPVNAIASTADGDGNADRVRPSSPMGVLARKLSTGEVLVAWHPGDDNVGVVGFNIYRDQKYYATSRTQVFVDSEPPASGTQAYQIVSFDEARNFSVASLAPDIIETKPDVDEALAGVLDDAGVAGTQTLYVMNLSSGPLVVFANGQRVGIWPDSLGAVARRVSIPAGMQTLQVLALDADSDNDILATLRIESGAGPASTLLIDDALLGK